MSTPYMGLTLPTVSVTAGPLYATENNAAFTTIDSHNHTSGQGAQIPTLGININADLAFSGFNALSLRSSRYSNQGSPLGTASDINCVYFSGGELYANDASGNQVKITSGGAVNVSGSGNITGMGATTATVAYSAGSQTFTFSSNTNVKAFLSTSSLSIATTTASADSVTLASGVLTGGAYTLTLPVAIATTNNALLMSSSSGVLSYLALGSAYQVPQVNSAGTALTYSTVSKNSLSSLGQQVSSSSGVFVSHSGTFVDVTNLTVTITTIGRPVMIFLQSDGPTDPAFLDVYSDSTEVVGYFQILRDGAVISQQYMLFEVLFSSHVGGALPPSSILFLDTGASAGSHTYKLQCKLGSTINGESLTVYHSVLVAYEL